MSDARKDFLHIYQMLSSGLQKKVVIEIVNGISADDYYYLQIKINTETTDMLNSNSIVEEKFSY